MQETENGMKGIGTETGIKVGEGVTVVTEPGKAEPGMIVIRRKSTSKITVLKSHPEYIEDGKEVPDVKYYPSTKGGKNLPEITQNHGSQIKCKRILLSELPRELREQLALVLPGDNAIFDGSYAKAVLGWYLKEKLQLVSRSTPLDKFLQGKTIPNIVLFYTGKNDIDVLESRFLDLEKRFVGTLKPQNVDVVHGNLDYQEDVEKYLAELDLTINQVLLIPISITEYMLVYTNMCQRDTVDRAGILTGKKPGMYRYSCGRKIPNNAAIARLIKALTEEVDGIYLPEWWLKDNAMESKESLGGYGLVLAKKYKDNKNLQQRLMKNLYDLKVIDIPLSYDTYVILQNKFYKDRTGKEFIFQESRTFRQMQEQKVQKEKERIKTKQNRNKTMGACAHEIVIEECDHCKEKCTIKKCTKCKFFGVIPKGYSEPIRNLSILKCNQNMETAFFEWNPNGFFWNK